LTKLRAGKFTDEVDEPWVKEVLKPKTTATPQVNPLLETNNSLLKRS